MPNDIPSWRAETGTKTGAERLLRSRLRLRHLRLLLAIAEHGTLQRASEAIGATQPAASKLVAELEAIAGAPLFARAARGLRANAAGEALTRHARAVLAQLAEAGQELQALAEGGGGAVMAGAVTAPALERLVPATLMLRARHPRLRITIEVAGSDALTVASRALARLYCPSRTLRILPWRRRFSLEPYGVIRPRGHVLSAAARLVLATAQHGTGPPGRGAEDEREA